MKFLRFKNPDTECRYPEDVSRIIKLAAERGYWLSRGDAQLAWEAYSETMAAGWMHLPNDDDELWGQVFPYLTGDDAD